jgi:hypothetical protein
VEGRRSIAEVQEKGGRGLPVDRLSRQRGRRARHRRSMCPYVVKERDCTNSGRRLYLAMRFGARSLGK